MKVIGYARVSTTNQDLVRQRTNIENFCKEQGYNLLYIIEDFGISGATNEREGYKRVMALTTSDCDLLVVSELSRLSRKEDITETLNDISKVVAHNGISMLLLDQKSKTYEGGVTLPIADLLMLIISLYGAAQERIETKRKVLDGKAAIFLANPYAVVDGGTPFGYRAVPNKASTRPRYVLEEDPVEVAYIKQVYDMVYNGMTLRQISNYFEDRNIYFRKSRVYVTLLSDITSNILYKGIRRRNRTSMIDEATVYEVHIKPIIEPEIWDAVQEKIKKNCTGVSYGRVYENPLKGILKCRCGRSTVVCAKTIDPDNLQLTYKCTCKDSKSNPNFCSVNRDQFSYTYTNSVIKALFIQGQTELADYFKKMGDSKINDLREVKEGLSSKIIMSEQKLQALAKQKEALAKKFLLTDVESLITAIQNQVKDVEASETSIAQEITTIKGRIAEIEKEIAAIEAMPTKEHTLFSLTLSELDAVAHQYLKRVLYHKVTHMKGIYEVDYINGAKVYVLVSKVPTISKAFLLRDDAEVNVETGDVTLHWETYTTEGMPEGMFVAPRAIQNTKTVNVADDGLFRSELLEMAALELDISDARDKVEVKLGKKKFLSRR